VDPTTAIRTDAFPAFATMVIPGAVAATPYAWIALSQSPQLAAFLSTRDALATFLAALTALTAGLIIESAGSYVEVGIEKWRGARDNLLDEWWKYLRITWDKTPIGQGYLRRQLVIFKFELNSIVALSFSLIGVLVLGYIGQISSTATIYMTLVLFAAFWLAIKAAYDSSILLADIRRELLRGVGLPPFDDDGTPTKERDGGRKPRKVWRPRD
jgi:hypothetical protein